MSSTSPTLLPPDEAERLLSLRHYDLVHALHEPVFDEFVALTARIFSLPISLISLVEADDVHYKGSYGLPSPDAQPRQEALCATAILHQRAVVYQDLATENNANLTAQAALAAQQHQLRFYAAAPLRMPDQHNIGALCVSGRQPRTFSLDEQQLLEHLAAIVSQTIAVRQRCLARPAGGEWHWHRLRTQLQEEVQALAALVRYLFVRHGTQVPVPADSLAQIGHRLLDVCELLDNYRG